MRTVTQFEQLVAQSGRFFDVARSGVRAAFNNAEHADRGTLSASRNGERVMGGDRTSPTEAAALARVDSRHARELWDAWDQAAHALRRVAEITNELNPPVARNAPSGKVIAGCANFGGCPEHKTSKKEGLCEACWGFRNRTGRHRTPQDIVDQIIERRAKDRLRKATA